MARLSGAALRSKTPKPEKPLSQKLGIKPGHSLAILDPPERYERALELPAGASLTHWPRLGLDFIQVFATEAAGLEARMPKLKASLEPDGMLWVSWPKKSSDIPTDLTDGVVRDIGLRNGLVDVKVCAIDERWSGLKFVRRLRGRT